MQGDEVFRSKLYAVKDRLQKAGVQWIVFAGAAAHCYGSRREVTDIDILVRTKDLEKTEASFEGIKGFDVVADLEIRTDHGICRFFMDDEMIEKARWMRLFGVTVPVVPVEDNIIFKAILQRGANQGKHDIDDIKCMIENEKINLEYLKRRIQKYQAARRVKPLLRRLIPDI